LFCGASCHVLTQAVALQHILVDSMPLIQCVASKASSRTLMNSDFCITEMPVRFKSLTTVLLMAPYGFTLLGCDTVLGE